MNTGTLIGLSCKDDLHSISLKEKNKHLTGGGALNRNYDFYESKTKS
jgi:hypothetical protein